VAICGNAKRLVRDGDDVVVRVGESLAHAKILSRTTHGCFVCGDNGEPVGVAWSRVFVSLSQRESVPAEEAQ